MGQQLSDEEEVIAAEVTRQQVEHAAKVEEQYAQAMKPAEPFVLPENLP